MSARPFPAGSASFTVAAVLAAQRELGCHDAGREGRAVEPGCSRRGGRAVGGAARRSRRRERPLLGGEERKNEPAASSKPISPASACELARASSRPADCRFAAGENEAASCN